MREKIRERERERERERDWDGMQRKIQKTGHFVYSKWEWI